MQFSEEVKELIVLLQLITACVTLVATIIALFLAYRIPGKIMVNQLYSNLEVEYRSPEMGAAILALFHFFVEECNGDIKTINDEYQKKYEEQIGKYLKSGEKTDFSHTLHFQRRLVAQFYYSLARLRFDYGCYRLSTDKLKKWFTRNENKLLSIILHLAEPASNVFIKSEIIPPPPQAQKEEVYMYKMIYKLYNEISKL
jgi:hypothetical protein